MENVFALLALLLAVCISCSGFSLDPQLYQTSLEDLRDQLQADILAAQAQLQAQLQPSEMPLGLKADFVSPSTEDVTATKDDGDDDRILDLQERSAAIEEIAGYPPRLRHHAMRRLRVDNDISPSHPRQKKEDNDDDIDDAREEFDDDDDDDDDVDYLDDREDAVVVSAMPQLAQQAAAVPFWHQPCGRSMDLMMRRPRGMSPKKARKVLASSLEAVWRVLNISTFHFHMQEFDKLYYKVLIGVDEHQYIPNWIPGKADIPTLQPVDLKSNEKLTLRLAAFHTQLQKFAVALEQITKDEQDDQRRQEALKQTQVNVRKLLCETEWALLSLALPVPDRISRDIMSESERKTVDSTQRAVRDWGVLLRYRDFLAGWADVVSQASDLNT